MAFKKKTSKERYYIFPLLDKVSFDQHMLFFSDFFNGFSYWASAWYSTLKFYSPTQWVCRFEFWKTECICKLLTKNLPKTSSNTFDWLWEAEEVRMKSVSGCDDHQA